MATLNWLHLSDWHQRGPDFDRKVVRDALLKDIRSHATISEELAHIDLVFFTGDLAFSGKKNEYEAARDLLLEPVRKALDLEVDRLILIPGNHDLDRSVFRYLPPAVLQPFTPQQANEWLTDDELRTELLKPFSAYQKFVTEYGVSGFGDYANNLTLTIGGKRIGILGCNSALMSGRRGGINQKADDYGALIVGEPQIYAPLQKLADADVRISLIHHPFEWLTEFDRHAVEMRLLRQCDFILRGHQHIPSVNVARGTSGNAIIIPTGASYDGRTPERPLYINAYNFVHYDTDTKQGTVHLRRWSDTRSPVCHNRVRQNSVHEIV